MVGLTTLLYILPLTFANNFLSHRTPDTFLQLIHPAWILLLTSSSHLPSLLTVEPRYLKFFALFTFSACNFNSSPSSTPPTLKYSVLLRLTFRPLLSSAFLQILQFLTLLSIYYLTFTTISNLLPFLLLLPLLLANLLLLAIYYLSYCYYLYY